MADVSGRIVVAQEGRFLLEDHSGGHRLFITSHPEHEGGVAFTFRPGDNEPWQSK